MAHSKEHTLLSLRQYLRANVSELPDDTIKGLTQHELNRNHPANREQTFVGFNRRTTCPTLFSLPSLSPIPVPPHVLGQIRKFESRKNPGLSFRLRKRNDVLVNHKKNPVSTSETASFTPTSTLKKGVDELLQMGVQFSHPLVKQWSPEAVDKRIYSHQLKNYIARVENMSEENPVKSKKYHFAANYAKRYEKLKSVGKGYKELLMTSIQDRLANNQQPTATKKTKKNMTQPQSPRTYISNAGSSPRTTINSPGSSCSKCSAKNSSHENFVKATDFKIKLSKDLNNKIKKKPKLMSCKSTDLISQISKGRAPSLLRKYSSRINLILKLADVGVKEKVDNFYKENPLTVHNYYRLQRMNKEVDCLSELLAGRDPGSPLNDKIVRLFKEKHKELGKTLFSVPASLNHTLLYVSKGQ